MGVSYLTNWIFSQKIFPLDILSSYKVYGTPLKIGIK